VSFDVSFSRLSVDLRPRCHDTDAQNPAYVLPGVVPQERGRRFGTRRSEVQILSPRLLKTGVFRSHG